MTTRRRFPGKFRAVLALETLRGDKTAQKIAARHNADPTQVTAWKRRAIERLTGVFSDKARKRERGKVDIKRFHVRNGKRLEQKCFSVAMADARWHLLTRLHRNKPVHYPIRTQQTAFVISFIDNLRLPCQAALRSSAGRWAIC